MIINMVSGAGASINFDVKAYATEAALLAAAPKENTIGIITTTAISSWALSATQPAEAAEGMVWISLGTSSTAEFNALKTNALQVYPIAASQYVGRVWKAVTAMSYQNGRWSEWWDGTLFSDGDQFESVTGGWGITGYTAGLPLTEAAISGGNIKLVGQSGVLSARGTLQAISFDEKTDLAITRNVLSLYNGSSGGLIIRKNKTDNDAVALMNFGTSLGEATQLLDISALSGTYYIIVYADGAPGIAIDVSEIKIT